MTDLRVLQEGRMRRSAREARRRRERRRRRMQRGGVTLVVVGAALLIVLATRTNPSATRTGHHKPTATLRPKPAPKARPARTLYARIQDPIQVDPRIQLPLKSGLLFNVTTGQVLWEKNPSEPLPIASLTKMMTALVVVTHSSPYGKVLITKQAIDFTGSGVGLLPLGKRVPEIDLLYGLLLPSGNDAAIALAQHVAGTRPNFVDIMNREAGRLGLTCTHYSNVSGVVDQGNYSCATDLAVLAHQVLTNPTLAPIVGSASKILPFPIKGGKLYLYNNNPLLVNHYPGTDGVKTGFTTAAGLCIVAAARRGSTWLAAVLLHSGNWYTQAETLLNAGFAATAAHTTTATHTTTGARTATTASTTNPAGTAAP